jgi:glycosyltransferase involved in cell wall biosynthesis
MKKVKVAHLTSAHPPFDVRIFTKECQTLQDAGFEVTIVAPHDKDEIKSGIQIRAVPIHKTRLARIFKAPFQVLAKAISENASIYHFHDPELLFIGMILKIWGKKVIYDVHENVKDDILTKQYIPLLLRKLISITIDILEKLLSLFFDAIVAATPHIEKQFSYPKIVGVYNYPVEGEFFLPSTSYQARPKWVAYIGGVTLIRGALEMIRSMEFCNATLVIAGIFNSSDLEETCRNLPYWQSVDFLGWLDRKKIQDLVSQARIGIIVFLPGPNHLDAYPNKLFEYMAAGIPVVASHFPLWRGIIESEQCGLVVDPNDPKAIGEAIQWLLDNPQQAEIMGKNGATAISTKFNWKTQGRKLVELYKFLV